MTAPAPIRLPPQWAVVVLLAALVLAAHWPALSSPLMFDDLHQIRDNQAMHDAGQLFRYFTDTGAGSVTGHGSFYRPLAFCTFLLDSVVFQGRDVGYRISSLLWLLVLTLVVQRFGEAFLGRIIPEADRQYVRLLALGGASLLAVHPLLNESVLLATSRSSLLMASFGLAALTAMLQEAGRIKLSVALLTICALLSKESAVTLGPAALLVAWAAGSNSRRLRSATRQALPVLLPVAAYVLFHFLVRPLMAGPTLELPASFFNQTPHWLYPAQGGYALLGLIRLFLLPWGMTPDHLVLLPQNLPARLFGYAMWPVLATAGVWICRRFPLFRLQGFALCWFLAALAPSLVLHPLNTPMAEHRAVLAAILPVIAVADLVLRHSGTWPRWVLTGLCLVLATAAHFQSRHWSDPIALWDHATRVEPASPRSWSFLASARSKAGDPAGADEAVRRALELEPAHPLYLTQAAALDLKTGRLVQAGDRLRQALAVENNWGETHQYQAEYLARTGNLQAALPHAVRGTELAPWASPAWNALGNVQLMLKNREAAAAAYRQAVELDPGNQQAAANLDRLQP